MTHSTFISLLAIDRFVEATRDSGYRGTGSAVSELVDNAIQANATKIAVSLQTEPDQEQDIVLSVLDNGCGMDPFTLRQALQFGGSSRFNDRSGIGRYGMGLPNSSFSQARRLQVYSWQHHKRKRGASPSVYSTGIDIDDIVNGVTDCIPKPKSERNPPPVCKGSSGTLVVWSHCDRLDYRRISTLANKLHEELGRRFRVYLWKGVRITINGQPVQPVDPLFLHPGGVHTGAKTYGKALRYEVSTNPADPNAPVGIVTVRFSELPVKRWRSLSNEQKRDMGISKGAGISILRAGREVDSGWFFMGGKRKENYDDWWRCEVSFDPLLDEVFGITHTKQQIRPNPYLTDILSSDMEAIAHSLNTRARNAHRQAANKNSPTGRSEVIAADRESLLAPLPVTGTDMATKNMQRLRRKQLITPSKSEQFAYRIITTDAVSTTFISYAKSKQVMALAINDKHPFFREWAKIEQQLPKSSAKQLETLIELLLLSAVRSEASAKKQTDREAIERYRQRWSDILATYLNR